MPEREYNYIIPSKDVTIHVTPNLAEELKITERTVFVKEDLIKVTTYDRERGKHKTNKTNK